MEGLAVTVEEMRTEKEKRHLSNEDISRASGVPFATVQKIFGGVTKSPRKATLMALEGVFGPDPKKNGSEISYGQTARMTGQDRLCENTRVTGADCIRESVPSYQYRNQEEAVLTSKKQGEFTIEDYLKLPDDKRYELIDGVLYAMSSPTSVHQLIAGQIYAKLLSFVASHQGNCVPFISPMDVKLDPDNRTMVEPDVMVICNRDKIRKARVYGAPDLVIEVLSGSTRTKDMIIKTMKYKNAGVREYWMIDPDRKNVMTYLFENDDVDVHFYSMEDQVPVHIFEDKCVIDFSEISNYISFVYENEKRFKDTEEKQSASQTFSPR